MGCNCEGYRKGLSRDVGGIPVDCAQSNHSSFVLFSRTAPQQVDITNTNSNTTSITISWAAIQNAGGFNISCSDGAPSLSNPENDGNLTEVSCTGVKPGGNHSITIITLQNGVQSLPTVEYVIAGNYTPSLFTFFPMLHFWSSD